MAATSLPDARAKATSSHNPDGVPPRRYFVNCLSPVLKRIEVIGELIRRLTNWMDIEVTPLLHSKVDEMLRAVTKSDVANRWAWHSLIANSWTTQGRFRGHTRPCLGCGLVGADRVVHIVSCSHFWRPAVKSNISGAWTVGQVLGADDVLLNPALVRAIALAYRAHCACGRGDYPSDSWTAMLRAQRLR